MPLLTTGAGKYGSAAVVPYNPAADAGMVVWYKADAGPMYLGSVPANGSPASHWEDSDPGGTGDLVAVSGNAIYETNSLNGLPGMHFVASGHAAMLSSTDAIALNSAVLSVFMLVKSLTGADGGGVILSVKGAGQPGEFGNSASFVIGQAGGTTQSHYDYRGSTHAGVSPDGDTALPFGTPKSVGLIFDGTLGKRYSSGVAVPTAGASHTALLGAATIQTLTLGSKSDSSQSGEFYLYELFMTVTNLTSQLAGVNAYFNNKWGIF